MPSSGIGGSNGHVVLEAPPEPSSAAHKPTNINEPVLFMAAGLSPRSASAIADHISKLLPAEPRSKFAAISTILGRRSKQMNWRSYAIASAVPGSSVTFSSPQYSPRDENPLVFVFSGQGPQHESMGRELFRTFPTFRESILEMDAVYRQKTKKSIIHDFGLFGSVPFTDFPAVWPISLTLPAIAMFQIASFDLLVHLGLVPTIILGHSAGETALLYACGAASKAMAVELAITRGEIFSALEDCGGTMAAITCSAAEAEELLAEYRKAHPHSVVELACINSPSAVAISGQERSIDALLHVVQRQGMVGRKIRTRLPIHSSMMDVCEARYRAEVQELFDRYPGSHVPKISTYSTLTGQAFRGPFNADYFWMNTRSQVLFAPAIQNLGGSSTFVEIAPRPVLSSYLSEMSPNSTVLSMIQRPKSGCPTAEYGDTLQLLGQLTVAGHNCVDFTRLNAAICAESTTKLPAYPFMKKQFPLHPDSVTQPGYHGPINRPQLKLNRDTHPSLSQHVIRGEPIWPAAGFLEMALEFGATSLLNISFRSMLALTESLVSVTVSLDGSYWKVTSSVPEARASNSGQIERLHADGYLSFEVPPDYQDLNISEIRRRCDSHVDSEFYPSLAYFSSYGPKFRRITNLYYNSNEALASIRGMDGSLIKENAYILHPAILDTCFQITAYQPFHGDLAPNTYYLPSRLGELILHKSPTIEFFPPHVYAHVQFSGWTPDSLLFNVTVVDDLGRRLCSLRNFEMGKHQVSPLREILSPLHIVPQPVFHGPRNAENLRRSPHESDLGGPATQASVEQNKIGWVLRLITMMWSTWKPEPINHCSSFDENSFLFIYELGDEMQLQWEFSGLNPSQELNIWILASEGLDAAAGLCLTRALRREYLFWDIRFASFPNTFSEAMRHNCLCSLPFCMNAEPDIIFSALGVPLVPRLVPLVFPSTTKLPSPGLHLRQDEAVVQILHSSAYPDFSAFVASVVELGPGTPDSEFKLGSLVVGFRHPSSGSAIDLGQTCSVPTASFPLNQSSVGRLPGVAASVLAPGLGLWSRPHRLRRLSILITHCDTAIGSTISGIYGREGLKFLPVNADATILNLARRGHGTFDLIISGYEDKVHVQILRTLLRPSTGKLFLWCQELPRVLQKDPCTIGDALRVAVSRGFLTSSVDAGDGSLAPSIFSGPIDPPAPSLRAVFDAKKTYVILGGIGSLGASVAVYMAQRGARHIVVTSRSGRDSLRKRNNLIAQRMFAYLEGLGHLDIRLAAVDGTSPEAMRSLFNSIQGELGGCFLLSVTLADGLFSTLGEEEFALVSASKTQVFRTLENTVQTSSLEFIIAFSSVTALVGTGGQTNYCVANGALEQLVALPNGFAFVCPGILDSVFMLGDHGSRLNHLLDWSISTDEMILWLDDAISKFQHGARFQRYIPNLDWEATDRTLGMPRLGRHMVRSVRDVTVETQVASEPASVTASRIIQNVLSICEDDFDPEVPLTSYGVDSLSASRLSFALRPLMEVTQLQLLADASLNDIIRKYHRSSLETAVVQPSKPMESESPVTAMMDDLVRRFSDRMAQLSTHAVSSTQDKPPTSHTILLTGSTGSLGCHILAHLLANDKIERVYALNRASSNGVDLVCRQAAALQDQGLPPTLARSDKLKLLVVNLEDDGFGISSQLMDELQSTVTHIIHNGEVDFMARLSDFENLIEGTNRLLEFAMNSKRSATPSLSFVSTIGVCQNCQWVLSAPELPVFDPKIAAISGYVESKWVGERLVQIASERRYLNTNVIRVGQLTGSGNGSWDISHWVPALVQSGVHIGCLPDGTDTISWIPISSAAAAIVDMQTTMNETLHIVHPRPTTWKTVMQPLASLIGVPLVPYVEWFARLRSTAEFTIPGKAKAAIALRLLDYFQLGLQPTAPNRESMGLLPKVVSDKGVVASDALKDEQLLPLSSTDVEKWVRYWRGVGLLPHGNEDLEF
ncbi:acyl transferase domain-containing protein [Mycena polygramma]|nr:acyl transferase domain-containing protein [Mycena polygramma]